MPEIMIAQKLGSILQITNNDPDSRNSLNLRFYEGFRDKLEEAGQDPSVGAIVLTGAGPFFCSGGNLTRLKQRAASPYEERRAGIEEHLHAMIRAMRACPKPVIAAVEGGAAGAGVSLAFACDMVVSARDAMYSIAYVKIGLTPDGGASAFFGQALPRQLVSELAMTGVAISADRLHDFGLVNTLTEPGEALRKAREIGEKLSAGPVRALGGIKNLCWESQSNTLEQQLELEARTMAEALGSEEGREGIDAFLEKRKPDFAKLRG